MELEISKAETRSERSWKACQFPGLELSAFGFGAAIAYAASRCRVPADGG